MHRLTSYQDAREALRRREFRQALYDEGERIMGGVIVNLHGDAHIARRRAENRLFRVDTFEWYEQEQTPATVRHVLAPALAAGRGELLQLAKRAMTTLSTDVAGVDLPRGEDGQLAGPTFDRFCVLIEHMARAATVAHATGDKAAIIDAGDAALAEFAATFFEPSAARRRLILASGEPPPLDVLTTLLDQQDAIGLSDRELLQEVAYYPWVGAHSTSAQFVHAMHHAFEWIDGDEARRSTLIDDPVLRQCIVHESLRLHPASPVAQRIALESATLSSGCVVEAGEAVTIDIERANRDPLVFGPTAESFDHDRVVADDVPRWGLSFGHGTHACLGRELAGGIASDDGTLRLQGAIALMIGELLAAGARRDLNEAAELDRSTSRVMWGRYPVTF